MPYDCDKMHQRVYFLAMGTNSKQFTRCFNITRRTLSNAFPSSIPKLPPEVNADNEYECISRVVTPLYEIPYEEQLELKYKWSKNIVSTIAYKLKKMNKSRNKNIYCSIESVKPSPEIVAYRNKDEFSIRCGVDGNPKTVGFFVGSPADGKSICVRGTHLINMKQKHKNVAQVFEDYLMQSKYNACHDFRDGGNWRNIVVRSNSSGQTMAVVIFHPQNLSEAEIQMEADHLKQFFVEGPGNSCHLHSLYFQACSHTRCTNDQAPFQLLHGEPHLVEDILGYKFRISPDSFFQVNKTAAEVLYKTVLSSAHFNNRVTLLDICSGTGTISILASNSVRGSLGVEEVRDAVIDARNNAALNNVYNAEFICGRVEKRLKNILEELDLASDIVAVLNPGRGGLSPKVINMLTECRQLNQIIYISCKADSPNTINNLTLLASKFRLKCVIPVDLFPHTWHTELIFLFVA